MSLIITEKVLFKYHEPSDNRMEFHRVEISRDTLIVQGPSKQVRNTAKSSHHGDSSIKIVQ